MADQALLRELLLASLRARGHELEDLASLEGGRWQANEPADGASAVAIVRRFDPAEYVRGAAAFVAALDGAARDEWYRGFTRTAFLVGDPGRVAGRFNGLITHRGGDDLAWAWSPTDRATLGLRRLLKPLRTTGAARLEPEVRCDLGGGREQEVVLATDGLPLERYAVHLNHTVCEALITGALDPDARVTLRHVAAIGSLEPGCPYVRVVPDPGEPGRLAAVACVREGEAR